MADLHAERAEKNRLISEARKLNASEVVDRADFEAWFARYNVLEPDLDVVEDVQDLRLAEEANKLLRKRIAGVA